MARIKTSCEVERTYKVQHDLINMATGETTHGDTETVTGPCGVPLFSHDNRVIGVCRSCLDGWTHPNNYPTEKGIAMIEQAKGAADKGAP